MRRTPHRRSRGAQIGSGIGAIANTINVAWAGWTAYSALLIDHNVPLPTPIEAEHGTLHRFRGGALAYYHDRSAQGRPLVLIHSINAGASAFEMKPLFEHFRGERPVYALDLPGFGFSERSDQNYTPELYREAISVFLEGVVRQPADVIAFSLSSEFTASAALKRPELFQSLALISPSGFQAQGGENQVQRSSARGTSERVLRALKWPAWSQTLYDLLATRRSIHYFLQRNFVGPVPPELVEYAYLTTHQPGARWAPLSFVSGKLFTPDIRAAVYEQLTLPVLVLYDRDPNVSFDRLPQILERPNWRAARISPTLGLPHWEQLPATAAALDHFWQQTPQRTLSGIAM